jgi:hypothetical protein
VFVAPVAYDGEAGAEAIILLAEAIHGANTEMVSLNGVVRKRGSDFANRREPVMKTRLTLSDRFCTPTLIRPEAGGWVMSHKLTWIAALLANAQACLPGVHNSLSGPQNQAATSRA